MSTKEGLKNSSYIIGICENHKLYNNIIRNTWKLWMHEYLSLKHGGNVPIDY